MILEPTYDLATERYAILAPILARYSRRFAVLDLGAGAVPSAPLSRMILAQHDATAVMIEQDYHDEPFGLDERALVLRQHFTVDMLERLADAEHFDVVLALNVLHWFPDDPYAATRAVLRLGSHVFVQIPYDDDHATNQYIVPVIRQTLESEGATIIGETAQWPGHKPRPIYHFHRAVRTLTRTALGAHQGSALTQIYATTDRCWALMQKHGGQSTPWVPGMNLWTWRTNGGAWPPVADVVVKLEAFPLPLACHGDIVPWNFVFDGQALTLVDGYESGSQFDDVAGLKRTVEAVQRGTWEER